MQNFIVLVSLYNWAGFEIYLVENTDDGFLIKVHCQPGPEGKNFFHAKKPLKNLKWGFFLALNTQMMYLSCSPTAIVGILTFMSRKNFMLS